MEKTKQKHVENSVEDELERLNISGSQEGNRGCASVNREDEGVEAAVATAGPQGTEALGIVSYNVMRGRAGLVHSRKAEAGLRTTWSDRIVFLQEPHVEDMTIFTQEPFSAFECFPKVSQDAHGHDECRFVAALFPKDRFTSGNEQGKIRVEERPVNSKRCQIFTISKDSQPWMTLCNIYHMAPTQSGGLEDYAFTHLDEAFKALRELYLGSSQYLVIAGDLNHNFDTSRSSVGTLFEKEKVNNPPPTSQGGCNGSATDRIKLLLYGQLPFKFLWEEVIEGAVVKTNRHGPNLARIDHFVCNAELTSRCTRRGAHRWDAGNDKWSEAEEDHPYDPGHRPIFATFMLDFQGSYITHEDGPAQPPS